MLATVSAAAGISGSVLTPVFGSKLADAVQVTLQAISGLLVLIPAISVTALAHSSVKPKVQAEAEVAAAKKTAA